MKREPNHEQKRAIEHFGDTILQAGAGSGKTFVLTRHLTYLFSKFIEEHESNPILPFEIFIKSKISKIVVMTFTNKAAGEIETRINDRIDEVYKETQDDRWKTIKSELYNMTLGTIHGFCLKVLKSDLIPDSKTDLQLLSDFDIQQFVKRSFVDYLSHVQESEVSGILHTNNKVIIEAFTKVFAEAELRLQWEQKVLDDDDSTKILNQILSLSHYDFPLSVPEYDLPKKETSWSKFLNQISPLLKDSYSLKDLRDASHYFNTFSRFPSAPKSGSDELRRFFQKMKSLREVSKKYLDEFDAYYENLEIINVWKNELFQVFEFMNERYQNLPGITFSDMEFLVLKASRDEAICKKLSEKFTYFVIDEFQDTSTVQFEIVENIIQGDFSKIFTIGDVKQAIYGFRGGEVSVFQRCTDLVKNNLELANNYRSEYSIVNFNNHFFESILKTGDKFELVDNSLSYHPQNFPETKEKITSVVKKVCVEIKDPPGKLSNKEINRLEAEIIADEISNSLEQGSQCVLYKKLAPSKDLMDSLIKRAMSFSCQVKVKLSEDPLLIMFIALLEERRIRKSDGGRSSFIVTKCLEYLQVPSMENIYKVFSSLLESFDEVDAFVALLGKIGLSNSFYSHNLSLIRSLLKACEYDIDEFLGYISAHSDYTYSIHLKYGDTPEDIQIMTVHASKGLEFKKVYLGGVSTNGRQILDHSLIGKLPGSFKWKIESSQKSFYSSPLFVLERLLNKEKEIFEDRRLFYVANTRAERYLSWVDFEIDEKIFKSPQNSWIYGLRKYATNFDAETREILFRDELAESQERAFFQKNSSGYVLTDSKQLQMLAEMSVTGFSSIALCARKFYLSNILKISEDEIESIISDNEAKSFDYEEVSTTIKSDSERGTFVHSKIQQMIERNLTIPLGLDKEVENGIKWVKGLLNQSVFLEVVSERAIKFSIFGQMFNGTPDLVLYKNDGFEIWDFKTGAFKSEAPQYDLQLLIYAYGILSIRHEYQDKMILLKLLYVDAQELTEVKLSYEEIKSEVVKYWTRINQPNLVNREHCSRCSFGKLCRF